ncbi:MAG: hypothetical protein K9L17_08525 [Clostridiales bacterium]|nr:hypothetical protein [Clostridiales bacterium]MCF8022720.1 hypothetical protein [Clostridiales bacterium]
MFNLPWKRKKKLQGEESECPLYPGVQVDEVEIKINGVSMCLKRKLNLCVPHEVSLVIPRVEITKKKYNKHGKITSEEKNILNSVTIVHAPRFRSTENSKPGTGNVSGNTPRVSQDNNEGRQHISPPDWNISFNPSDRHNLTRKEMD